MVGQAEQFKMQREVKFWPGTKINVTLAQISWLSIPQYNIKGSFPVCYIMGQKILGKELSLMRSSSYIKL